MLSRLQGGAERWAAAVERHHILLILVLAFVYSAFVLSPANLILWHDELFTYYISKSSSVHEFIHAIRALDLNPPLLYLSARLSENAFGDSPWVTRLPSMVAFFSGSIALIYFLARRVGFLWGIVAALLVWYSNYFRYATEARPYALLFFFFAFMLLSYDCILRGQKRGIALAGILICGSGMMLSHVFGLFSILPFCLAELVRSYRARKVDWPTWVCLLLPLGLGATYIPLIARFQAQAFPAQFQGGPKKLAAFYTKRVISDVTPGLLLTLIAALAVAPRVHSRKSEQRFTVEHATLFAGLMLAPVLINLMLMRTHGAFWERYCITTAIGEYLVIALFIGYQVNFSRVAALTASVALAIFALSDRVIIPHEQTAASLALYPKEKIYEIKPNLPFVVGSGLTFLALDRHEQTDFLRRVYYLTDRAAALHYVHTTIFEGMGFIRNYFPIRARVVPYTEFTTQHPHFLVLGTMYYEEDWLLRKLKDDGAALNYLGDYNTPYKDHEVYEVTMPPSEAGQKLGPGGPAQR